jgi:hypothetical protein
LFDAQARFVNIRDIFFPRNGSRDLSALFIDLRSIVSSFNAFTRL